MKNLTTLLAIIFMASTTLLASYIEDEKETIPIPIKVGDLENSHIFRTPIVIPLRLRRQKLTSIRTKKQPILR